MFASNSVILPQLPTCLLAVLPTLASLAFFCFLFLSHQLGAVHILCRREGFWRFSSKCWAAKNTSWMLPTSNFFCPLREADTWAKSQEFTGRYMCEALSITCGIARKFFDGNKKQSQGGWQLTQLTVDSWPRPQQSSLGDCCCQLVTQLNSAARARPISAYY